MRVGGRMSMVSSATGSEYSSRSNDDDSFGTDSDMRHMSKQSKGKLPAILEERKELEDSVLRASSERS